METDFLNFHDGEHFSVLDSPDFQERSNSLLDDYCSHFSFSRHSSDDYIESTSSFWEQDEEQELNGDIAVIPVSGQINREIPQLSSSPDCKDDFMIDWHHFVAIENNSEKEDTISQHHYEKSPTPEKQLGKINAETAQQNQIENNLSDNCKNLSNPNNLNYDQVIRNINQEYHNEKQISKKSISDEESDTLFKDIDTEKIRPLEINTEIFIKSGNSDETNPLRHLNLDSANDILFDKDFLNCKKTNLIYDSDSIRNIKEDFSSENQKIHSPELFIKSEILPDLNLDSAANELLLNSSFDKLDLITAVTKDDIELDLSIDSDKLEDLHQPDFDKDDFDLTSYINDDDSDPIAPIATPSENLIPKSDPIPIKNATPPKTDLVDTDDDCIDVETVSPTGCRPVLEAKDVTSLLEQFEANEAVNVSIIDDNVSSKNVKKLPEVRKSTISYSKRKALSMEDIDEKKNKVVDRIKANVKRKSVPVIEPVPNVKNHTKLIDYDKKIMQKKVKSTKANQTEKESYRLDHDYCSISGPNKQNQIEGIDYYKVLRRQDISCGQGIGSKGIRCIETSTNNPKIEDTAIRIADKTKTQTFSSKKIHITTSTPTTSQQKFHSLLKSTDNTRMQNSPKSVLLKNNTNSLLKTSNYKNVDGKLMVSVLKTNQKMKNTLNPTKMAYIETKTPRDQCIQNIIVDSDNLRPKKRKLNLEEYKKRREINKTRSCDNSRTNSPINVTSGSSSPLVNHGSFSLPVTAVGSPVQPNTTSEKEVKKLTHEEMLLKMAADLLTATPMKTTEQKAYKIEPFTPPGTEVLPKVPEKPKEHILIPPKPCDDNIEMITIVSIGVNTDLSLINEIKPQPAPKIQFQIKKKQISTVNKLLPPQNTVSKQLVEQLNLDADEKLTEIITPILQNANSSKINSNSLISNITATILQKKRSSVSSSSPRNSDQDRKSSNSAISDTKENQNEVFEHGEDKTVIILDKNRVKPKTTTIEIQTEHFEIKDDKNENHKKILSDNKVEVNKVKVKRQYRVRRESYTSTSSVETTSSKKSKSRKSYKPSSSSSTSRSLSTSISSIDSNCSRSSRSKSRSRSYSRSLSRSSYSSSSTSSSSSRSRSRSRCRSRSHHRYDSSSSRNSRDKYSRSRRRSRSNHSYRSYKRSRSPLKRSNDRKSRSSWEQMDPEKLRQVEERRVIYVGRLLPGTTKNDLKRRFSKFGPVIETSVHFRDKGDNYGFVTFQYNSDAYEAIERGNEDPNLPQYDISFGGRRVFCQTRYADLDNIEAIEMNCYNRNIQEDSFDILLKEAQAKLRKRKV